MHHKIVTKAPVASDQIMRVDALLKPFVNWPAPLRVLAFLLVLALLWAPLAIPLSLLITAPAWQSVAIHLVLYLQFMWLVRRWVMVAHGQAQPFVSLGLLRSRNFSQGAIGFTVGAAMVFVMFGLEILLGWANWLGPGVSFPRQALDGLLVGIGIGFAEELLFRGWMLGELERDYAWRKALWGHAIVFALLHFLKPLEEVLRTWPQFLGLVILGVILGLAKRATQGRLGLAMGLHGGLVGGYYWLNVGELVDFTQRVPDWVTGVDRNPLAGLVGLVFLAGMAGVLGWMGDRNVRRTSI